MGVTHVPDKTKFCLVLCLVGEKKNQIGLNVIGCKSQCLRNKKEVRDIKFPELPIVHFFVQGKVKKKANVFTRELRWKEEGDGKLETNRNI